jgi:hypothetical protein
MRRPSIAPVTAAVLVVLVAAFVAACQGPQARPSPQGEQVDLLTGQPPGVPEGSCYTFGALGLLQVNATYGTVIADENTMNGASVPVMWRRGFTGWRVGTEIEVRDATMNVVATTGRRYSMGGGFVDLPSGARAFFSCSGVEEK